MLHQHLNSVKGGFFLCFSCCGTVSRSAFVSGGSFNLVATQLSGLDFDFFSAQCPVEVRSLGTSRFSEILNQRDYKMIMDTF